MQVRPNRWEFPSTNGGEFHGKEKDGIRDLGGTLGLNHHRPPTGEPVGDAEGAGQAGELRREVCEVPPQPPHGPSDPLGRSLAPPGVPGASMGGKRKRGGSGPDPSTSKKRMQITASNDTVLIVSDWFAGPTPRTWKKCPPMDEERSPRGITAPGV